MNYILFPKLLLFTFFICYIPIFSQGFNFGDSAQIDSLLHSRVDISEEAEILFDYLTNFQYYDYDELNEFVKARQVAKNNQIIDSLKNVWLGKYLFTLSDGNIINSFKEPSSFFYLFPYDFDNSQYKIFFGRIPKFIELDKPKNSILKIADENKLDKGSDIVLMFRLILNKQQTHSFNLTISMDEAENLKHNLMNELIRCKAAINFSCPLNCPLKETKPEKLFIICWIYSLPFNVLLLKITKGTKF